MTIKRKMVLPLALALGALGLMVVAQMASATHPRPKGATPLRVSLVPAYVACPNSAPPANRQHGAPLAALSCNPPVQTSNFLTVGTGDAWIGTLAKGIASVRLDVKVTSPEDVKIVSSGTDIRCNGANAVPGFCTNANTDNANVPDYSGQIQGTATIRITDHFNGPVGACGACTDPATVQDLTFPVTASCANSPPNPVGPTVGSTCNVSTTANGVVPSSVQDNKRANVEVQTININDGGSSGAAGDPGATLFGTQGIFIP